MEITLYANENNIVCIFFNVRSLRSKTSLIILHNIVTFCRASIYCLSQFKLHSVDILWTERGIRSWPFPNTGKRKKFVLLFFILFFIFFMIYNLPNKIKASYPYSIRFHYQMFVYLIKHWAHSAAILICNEHHLSFLLHNILPLKWKW